MFEGTAAKKISAQEQIPMTSEMCLENEIQQLEALISELSQMQLKNIGDYSFQQETINKLHTKLQQLKESM